MGRILEIPQRSELAESQTVGPGIDGFTKNQAEMYQNMCDIITNLKLF